MDFFVIEHMFFIFALCGNDITIERSDIISTHNIKKEGGFIRF